MPEKIVLLGSTGSIGTQALDVIARYPDKFEVEALTACDNIGLLTRQAKQIRPRSVVISNTRHYSRLRDDLRDTDIKVYAGDEAIERIVAEPDVDVVVAAIVGYPGLKPTISAIRAGKKIALANKESLVVAGEIISNLVRQTGSRIIPVDSEHSAIFQCLSGEENNQVEAITLTASGGPFLNFSHRKLHEVKPCDALRHPNWNMGDKVTVDSASMMNKGLEVIEASWLFNLDPRQIKVVIHPQSIIHSMVHFSDGSVKAQLGIPDMRIPILYALSYPVRLSSDLPRLELKDCPALTFSEPDLKKFRSLSLAYLALSRGGNMPCIMNAANEVAVKSFLSGKTGFMQMPEIIEYTMLKVPHHHSPDLESLAAYDMEAREEAANYIKKHNKKR